MKPPALIAAVLVVAASAFAGWTAGAQADDGSVQLKSLRGPTPIDQTTEPDMFKSERDRPPITRTYLQQPPLIPHSIRGYQITTNFNKCLDCHAWSRVKESGATKIGISHFKDAEGKELANVSPRRYFCTQCHVPQTDAAPLVTNTFEGVGDLGRR